MASTRSRFHASMNAMRASDQKQLNIRSDEAYATARDLAARMGTSTTEIVIAALREFKANRSIPSRIVTAAEAESNRLALLRSVRARGASGLSSVHDDLYDHLGLPK